MFLEILFKLRLSSTKICENLSYFLQKKINSRTILPWKIPKLFTQVLSYVVCTLLRRHIHKKITKKRYRVENPGRFVFGKPIFSTLGLGLTTPYSPTLFVCKFYQRFVIECIEFWMRFEPQIHPKKIAINFLFIIAKVLRKVRLCVKLFDFFPRWILIRLTWNLSRFVPNSVKFLTWN